MASRACPAHLASCDPGTRQNTRSGCLPPSPPCPAAGRFWWPRPWGLVQPAASATVTKPSGQESRSGQPWASRLTQSWQEHLRKGLQAAHLSPTPEIWAEAGWAKLRPPQASVALWCGSITVAMRLLSLLLIDSLTSGHVAQVTEPRCHVGLGSGGLRALSPSPGQAAGVGTPTRPQRWEWAKWAPPAVHTAFPVSEAAQTHNVPLIIVQRPKRCSWSECIKCRLKKDFTRLVTAENNLNFNSPGRNFKKKNDRKCSLPSHMDSISDRRSGLEASRQIVLHMWDRPEQTRKRSFVFSLF